MNTSTQRIVLRLGTRRSALACAQSSWVARRIEELQPRLRVELIGIETQGDRIQEVPLHQIDGKDFFSAELDRSLLNQQVDITVHSMKDLSLDRPPGIALAAIPKREDSRDVVIFHKRVKQRIADLSELVIGSSAPRRHENIPAFLKRALPGSVGIQWMEIRGNIDTRLKRIYEDSGHPRLDGVVLALAGLNRLWADPEGKKKLRPLLENAAWVILPLSRCPTAPGQGALAIECRADDLQVKEILSQLHDPVTAHAVGVERSILASWGGGCHQRLGATAVQIPGVGNVLYLKGKRPTGESMDEIQWAERPPPPTGQIQPWDGIAHRDETCSTHYLMDATKLEEELSRCQGVFVSHARALPLGAVHVLSNKRVFVAGVPSWFELARQGVWVEACAEGLGAEVFLKEAAPVFSLPLSPDQICTLTHRDAFRSEGVHAISTYDRKSLGLPRPAGIDQATHVFWGSSSQYNELKDLVPPGVVHSCGPGKTREALLQALSKGDIRNLKVFPSSEEWRKWVKTKASSL